MFDSVMLDKKIDICNMKELNYGLNAHKEFFYPAMTA